jgi:quinol-cytochrome oxidoreductase complex cytochrome b subunit
VKWALRVVWAVLAVCSVVLLVTGIWLWGNYVPVLHARWNPDVGLHRTVHRMVLLHRWSSQVGLACAEVGAVLLLVRRWRQWPVAIWLVVIAAALSFTGSLLPWDQLSLWAVTVGADIKGYAPVFSDQVRFVLVGGVELSKETVQRWAIVHTVVLPSVAILVPAIAVVLRRRVRPRRVPG